MPFWLSRLPLRAIVKLVVKAAAAAVCFIIGNDTAVRDLANNVVRETITEITVLVHSALSSIIAAVTTLVRSVLPSVITSNMAFS
jgi:hypothetical protein